MEVGQTYVLVWSCLPQMGCYGEIVRVEAVRADGWVDVVSCPTQNNEPVCGSDRWRSQLSQMLSIQRVTLGRRAD